ncbi:hypothetical protein MKW94_006894 [Papaver nudicaule]|uniref:Xyloglucan endotransglucosylase/hydrolase n=1 Tax=Papaver nudicaule TaxID=74823 RepID=A0AA41V5Y9_PAPNU|nr:hypothetical protein [Papaver nudicaule]
MLKNYRPLFFFTFLLFPGLLLVSAQFSEIDLSWGGDRAKIIESGRLLQLSLDQISGAGFQTRNEYLFGRIDMQIKVVPGNSAGTVTAYYLSSSGTAHDEIDFEFLGNVSGEPYILHTNIYTQGKGEREQQFYLWFDPRLDFHTYSILWNEHHIVFSVDDTPIRIFRNAEHLGVPYPKSQPMRLYSSLWCADNWATRGGIVKTDWSRAPFVASYRAFKTDACTYSAGKSSCSSFSVKGRQALGNENLRKLRWVQRNYMIYNYCTDYKRFPQGVPPECKLST